MINPFPTLLDFGLLAPTILRLVLGGYFIYLGYIKLSNKTSKEENISLWDDQKMDLLGFVNGQKFSHKHKGDMITFFDSLSIGPAGYYLKTLAIAEVIAGAFLFVGFFTQMSAIVTGVISLVSFIVAYKHRHLSVLKPGEYLLLMAISFSLILSGAGAFAIDLPL